jgi:ABC-type glycerol-3-phosphate transport system substrate-binding protein
MPGANSPESLIRWMLERPGERLFGGLLMPVGLLAAFVGVLLINTQSYDEYVWYNPETGKAYADRRDAGPSPKRRLRITYWEKWSGFEGQAIQDAVDAFNRKPERDEDLIFIQMIIQGDISEKTKIAIAGGDPPDLAGLYSVDVPVFAAHNALLPLDEMMADAGIGEQTFVKVYWDLCRYKDRTWAIPSTPSTWALHWNKKLFRDAGLDPEQPPRTLSELDAFARKLTKVDDDGRLTQVGYLPTEPGWWKYPWALWFGGTLWNGRDRLTFDSPESVRAMRWIRSYSDGTVYQGIGPEPIGYAELDRFKKTFGDFSTSDNAFFTGKVAMEIQGVWMAKFIDTYAPDGFEWGCAAFPAAAKEGEPGVPILKDVTVAEADVIGIPRGSKHPDLAFTFIEFMSRPEGMEILCLGQGKHSPLRKVSGRWYKEHPHPHIQVFEDLGESPNCFRIPPIGIWRECATAWGNTFDDIWSGRETPKDALTELQALMQRRLEREFEKLEALGVR